MTNSFVTFAIPAVYILLAAGIGAKVNAQALATALLNGSFHGAMA